MTKRKWYSPQISREIVSRLYFKARAECIPMTRLASRLIGEALGPKELTDVPTVKKRSIGRAAENNSDK